MTTRGVTAILYDIMDKPYFLVMHRNQNWQGWEFIKGNLENGETPEQAVLREIKEEAGIITAKVKKMLDKKKEYKNEKGEEVSHDVFIVESSINTDVKLGQEEHDTFLWAPADSVRGKLTWDCDKEAFEMALREIKNLR